jgi:hypothetical protein
MSTLVNIRAQALWSTIRGQPCSGLIRRLGLLNFNDGAAPSDVTHLHIFKSTCREATKTTITDHESGMPVFCCIKGNNADPAPVAISQSEPPKSTVFELKILVSAVQIRPSPPQSKLTP